MAHINKGICINGHDTSLSGSLVQQRDKSGKWYSKCARCLAESRRAHRRSSSYAQQQRTQTVHDNMRIELGIPKPKGYQWQEAAACLNENPELFFSNEPIDQKKAKEVCTECPVMIQCLSAHIFEHQGIFGGTTPHERDNLRSKGYKRARAK